jgi:hypothetical protein
MNSGQDFYQVPPMKASDADRDAVVATLSEHYQAGRLTTEELEERTGRALAARTLKELGELTADLPAVPQATAVQAARQWRFWPSALLPVAALVVIAVIAVLAFGDGSHHGWAGWWVIPVGLLVARRIARRRGLPPGSRRGFPPDSRRGFPPDSSGGLPPG